MTRATKTTSHKKRSWKITVDVDESAIATVQPVPAGTCGTIDVITGTIEELNEMVVNFIADRIDRIMDDENIGIDVEDIEWRIDFIGLTDMEQKYLLTNDKPGLKTAWEFDGEEVSEGVRDFFDARYRLL